jgi:hypothetical protein
MVDPACHTLRNLLLVLDNKTGYHKNLTNSMEQSPSRETNRPSASEEIPSSLWNPKVHYRIHNSQPLVSILSQTHQVQVFPPCFSEIHSTIPSNPRLCLPSDLFPSGFLTKNPYAFLIAPMRATCPAHPRFDHSNNIW